MPAPAAHLPAGAVFDASARGGRHAAAQLARHFARAPERIALIDERGSELSYGALDAASRRAAGRLHGAGLRTGDRVLVSAAASLDSWSRTSRACGSDSSSVPANTAYRGPSSRT
jgi:acyl-CoA synthetase (AMP-forming)/AMP-acid ligase II